MQLPYQMERSVIIQASPETVFDFFRDSAKWAQWWGDGSIIEARPGGKLLIRHPNGAETLGEVLEVAPPRHIVFTYGYASGPIPPGGSRVTIRLEPCSAGTRLQLVHEFSDAAQRDHHVQGWRFQLSLFANIVANQVFAGAARLVDAWYGAWNITDDRQREEAFARIVSQEVSFRDRNSLLEGLADLCAHAGAAQRFMPGIRLERRGEPRHCLGMVISEWVTTDSAGKRNMSGTSVFILGPDGRINSATGFANPATV